MSFDLNYGPRSILPRRPVHNTTVYTALNDPLQHRAPVPLRCEGWRGLLQRGQSLTNGSRSAIQEECTIYVTTDSLIGWVTEAYTNYSIAALSFISLLKILSKFSYTFYSNVKFYWLKTIYSRSLKSAGKPTFWEEIRN